ncbi:MAG: hypothetical protein JOZ73_05080 [Solirubrobacterales bacterium]|nr:hypothetical protein [Solirubrobacterales bacterium]
MNVENVTRDDWIIAGLAALLIIGLLAFPWFSIGGGSAGPITLPSYDLSATDAPDGWTAILALLVAIVLIADLAIERFSPHTALPNVGGSRTATRLILAAVAAGFVLLKFLLHIHFSLFGWGFYVDVIIAAALVFFALQANAGAIPGRPGALGAAPATGRPGAPGAGSPRPGGGTAPPPGGGAAPPPGGGTAPPPGGGSTPPPPAGGAGGTPGTPPGTGGSPPPPGSGDPPPPAGT